MILRAVSLVVIGLIGCASTGNGPMPASAAASSSVTSDAIDFYQRSVRPYYVTRCPFEPTCSEFSRKAFEQYGWFQGFLMTADRLTRCNALFPARQYPRILDGKRVACWDPPAPELPPSLKLRRTGRRAGPPATDLRPTKVSLEGLPAQSMPHPDASARYDSSSAEEQRSYRFLLELSQRAEFLEVQLEAERFLFEHPAGSLKPDVEFLLGRSFLAVGDWPGAEKTFRSALTADVKNPLSSWMTYCLLYCLFRQGRWDDLDAESGQFLSYAEPEWTAEVHFLLFLAYCEQRDWGRARAVLDTTAPKPFPIERSVAEALLVQGHEGEKSPALGSALSSIMPGLGQLYAGHAEDAAMSFFWTVLFGWGSYEAFQEDLDVAGALLGLVAIGFYASNIYGGARAVERSNQRKVEESARKIRLETAGRSVLWEFDRGLPPAKN